MIELEGVTKQFPGGAVAVDHLSLNAPDRAITVLVGPSGCGKTTTLRMINRMVEPTSGTIRIDGTDVQDLDPAQLRRGIGYVIQHGGLFPHHTVERNVAAVPLLLGEKTRTAIARARELLELVGIDPALGRRYPSQLSGGQQQRVGVARALAADPPVMLMDEPFSAVDPVVREQLQDEFLRLQGEIGKTIVMVTHDIDEAIKLGDHVAVLRTGGVLAQMATPRDLLASPADGFVADFLGKDRGYRALGFDAADYPVHEEATVVLGVAAGTADDRSDDSGWVLVTDEGRHPLGWARPADAEGGAVTEEDLALGGTLATVGGPLRGALDAALSSPSKRGVVVDEDGVLVGTCLATEVLEVIESRDRQQAPSSGGS